MKLKHITKRLKQKKPKQKIKELAERMKLLFSVLIFLGLVACGNHRDLNEYSRYVKVVSNADSTINELSAISDSEKLNGRLNARFQSFSENKTLTTTIPKERIEEKAALWEECKVMYDSCSFVPEGYSFNTSRNFLNLTYQYNAFGSHDLFYKHGVVNLSNGRRLMQSTMYTEPIQVLEMYNTRYVQEYEDYLASFASNDLSEDDQEEYDVIRNHLDSRTPFKLSDLDNIELILGSKKRKFTEIRFHYNGSGGVYKNILTEGFISFTLKELDDLLLSDFKDLLH